MRGIRRVIVAVGWLIAVSAATPVAQARTLVDPTSLTPPLKPFRICYELGPYVQCDTSGDTTYENEPAGEPSCGVVYETGEEVSHSIRWYQDGLIIRRQVQEHDRGFWSLSPDVSGPIVEWERDFSWNEEFAVPGDIDSAVRILKGASLRVPALGPDLHESGWAILDGDDRHGHFTNDDSAFERVCPFLLG